MINEFQRALGAAAGRLGAPGHTQIKIAAFRRVFRRTWRASAPRGDDRARLRRERNDQPLNPNYKHIAISQ